MCVSMHSCILFLSSLLVLKLGKTEWYLTWSKINSILYSTGNCRSKSVKHTVHSLLCADIQFHQEPRVPSTYLWALVVDSRPQRPCSMLQLKITPSKLHHPQYFTSWTRFIHAEVAYMHQWYKSIDDPSSALATSIWRFDAIHSDLVIFRWDIRRVEYNNIHHSFQFRKQGSQQVRLNSF